MLISSLATTIALLRQEIGPVYCLNCPQWLVLLPGVYRGSEFITALTSRRTAFAAAVGAPGLGAYSVRTYLSCSAYAEADDPADHNTMTLVFGVNTEDDLVLREELYGFKARFSERFDVVYTVSSLGERG